MHNCNVIAARDANPVSPEELRQFNALGNTPGWKVYERISNDPSFARHITSILLSLPMFSDRIGSTE